MRNVSRSPPQPTILLRVVCGLISFYRVEQGLHLRGSVSVRARTRHQTLKYVIYDSIQQKNLYLNYCHPPVEEALGFLNFPRHQQKLSRLVES